MWPLLAQTQSVESGRQTPRTKRSSLKSKFKALFGGGKKLAEETEKYRQEDRSRAYHSQASTPRQQYNPQDVPPRSQTPQPRPPPDARLMHGQEQPRASSAPPGPRNEDKPKTKQQLKAEQKAAEKAAKAEEEVRKKAARVAALNASAEAKRVWATASRVPCQRRHFKPSLH